MKFAALSLDDAEGAVLAHGLRLKKRKLAKGHTLSAADVASLRAAGFAEVVAARLENDDFSEDVAATGAAQTIAGSTIEIAAPFTGRCNLYASVAGLLQVDRAKIDELNAIDEAVTLATVAPDEPVASGQLIATVKVIPLGIARKTIDSWAAAMSRLNHRFQSRPSPTTPLVCS